MKITITILTIFTLISVLITGFWEDVTKVIFPNSTWGLYNRDFFENLLVEIHGTIIDIFIVGIILYWFEQRREKQETLIKLENKLENLKYYRGQDSAIIFYATLRHLISLNRKKVSIPEANLSNLNIKNLMLSSSNLIATNFSKSHLYTVKLIECNLEASQFIDTIFTKVEFQNVNLKRSKFINSKLKGMDFRTCDIRGVNFKNSSLQSSNFKGVDCSQVSFKGANLRSANFKNAINITKEMILEASNYDYIKLPNEILI